MSTLNVDALSTGVVEKDIYSVCRQRYADDKPFILLPSRRTACTAASERSWIVCVLDLHGFEYWLCRATQAKILQRRSGGAVISLSVIWHMQQPVRQPVRQVFRYS